MSRKRNTGLEVANEGRGDRVAIPFPGKRSDQVAIPSQELPASAEWVTGDPIDVAKSRFVHFYVVYTSTGAGGEWGLLPEMNAGYKGDEESKKSTNWIPLDAVPNNAAVNEFTSTTMPSDSTHSGDKFDKIVTRPVLYAGAPTTGAETVATVVTLNVESAQKIRVSMAELAAGAGGAGTMEVRFTKST